MRMEQSLGSLQNEEKDKTCPDCGGKEFELKNGEVYCKKCGLVLD